MMSTTLFETLAIKDGQVLNIDYHNERFIRGQRFLNCQNIIHDMSDLIDLPKDIPAHKLIRCRVTYRRDDVQVAHFDYEPKLIHSFKLVTDDDIEYEYKYDDREALNQLLSHKGNCDEIIIIKNNFVTDCSIGNLLFLKKGHWYTPNTPLLKGTQRAYLLEHQKIRTETILKKDIWHYEKIMMINALNPFDERRAVNIFKIHDV